VNEDLFNNFRLHYGGDNLHFTPTVHAVLCIDVKGSSEKFCPLVFSRLSRLIIFIYFFTFASHPAPQVSTGHTAFHAILAYKVSMNSTPENFK